MSKYIFSLKLWPTGISYSVGMFFFSFQEDALNLLCACVHVPIPQTNYTVSIAEWIYRSIDRKAFSFSPSSTCIKSETRRLSIILLRNAFKGNCIKLLGFFPLVRYLN